jgi:hypothetical protein
VSQVPESPRLDAKYVEETVHRLEARIRARFPDRRLGNAAQELGRMVPEIQAGLTESKRRRSNVRLVSRATSVLIVVLVLVALGVALRDAVTTGPEHSFDWVSLSESLVNDVIFAAIAVAFLWLLPERLERRALLDLLHKLRSQAHVVDMHQLDKDPEQARPDYVPTPKSPVRRMNAEELHHYFDYCSELVSLIAKTAALCAERTSDPVVLRTVSEIETLAAQMSQKIWQKISLLPEHP